MIVDGRSSLAAAARIDGTSLLAYVVAHGWTVTPSKVDGIWIASRFVEGADAPISFLLPLDGDAPGARPRLADALRTLSQIGGCSEESMALDIMRGRRSFGTGEVRELDAQSERKPNMATAERTTLVRKLIQAARLVGAFTEEGRSSPDSTEPERTNDLSTPRRRKAR